MEPEDMVTAQLEGVGPNPYPAECQECGTTLTRGENCDHFIVTDEGVLKMNL